MSRSVRVSCWNVLADCYFTSSASNNSHNLSSWSQRFSQTREIITSIAPDTDIFMLQEIDHLEDCYGPLLKHLGYDIVYVKRPGKEDGCLLAYERNMLELVQSEEVSFDDLAHMFSSSSSNQGVGYRQSSFLRHNVAIIAHLRFVQPAEEAGVTNDIIVAVPHLYWNPNFADVKDGQATYLLDRIGMFKEQISSQHTVDNPPVLIGGDFNSLPDSNVYKILTTPFSYLSLSVADNDTKRRRYGQKISTYHMDENDKSQVKFLCHSSLSKFCRWLRVLGINCAMYKPFECQKPHDHDDFFSVAREGQRIILTSARKMMERSACPEAFLVDTKNLEGSLVALFQQYNIPLEISNFLTVCGKCGGDVVQCHSEEYKRYLQYKSGKVELNVINDKNKCDGEKEVWVPEDRQIFMCMECLQPYWWSENEISSPARAMRLAHRLYTLVNKSLMSDDGDMSICGDDPRELSKADLKHLFDQRDATLMTFSKHKHAQLLSQSFQTLHISHEMELKQTTSTTSMNSVAKCEMKSILATDTEIISSFKSKNLRLNGQGMLLTLSSVHHAKHGFEPAFTNCTETFRG